MAARGWRIDDTLNKKFLFVPAFTALFWNIKNNDNDRLVINQNATNEFKWQVQSRVPRSSASACFITQKVTSKRSANGSANDKISLNVITASVDIAQVSPGEMRADYAVSQTFNWQQARPFFFRSHYDAPLHSALVVRVRHRQQML